MTIQAAPAQGMLATRRLQAFVEIVLRRTSSVGMSLGHGPTLLGILSGWRS